MGDIKNWMRRQVTILRKKLSKILDEFILDLEAFVETKGLRTLYENYKLAAKNKQNTPINAASAKDLEKIKNECKKVKTAKNLEMNATLRTDFKNLALRIEANPEMKTKYTGKIIDNTEEGGGWLFCRL